MPCAFLERLESEPVVMGKCPSLTCHWPRAGCGEPVTFHYSPMLSLRATAKGGGNISGIFGDTSDMHRFSLGPSSVNDSLDVSKDQTKPPLNHVCYFQVKITFVWPVMEEKSISLLRKSVKWLKKIVLSSLYSWSGTLLAVYTLSFLFLVMAIKPGQIKLFLTVCLVQFRRLWKIAYSGWFEQ